MGPLYRLPDLRLVHAIEERIRAASDPELPELFATNDARWLFVECAPYVAVDVVERLTDDAFDDFALAQCLTGSNRGGAT